MSGTRAMLLPALVLSGCFAQTERGDLTVSWTIGLDQPTASQCESAGIETISMRVAGTGWTDEVETGCPAGERFFSAVPVGEYSVTLRGLDAGGCAVYGGSLSGVHVASGSEPADAAVILESVTPSGSMMITWRFEDGMMCGAHGIEEVHVQILSDDATVYESDLPCDDGLVDLEEVPAGSIDLMVSAFEGPMEMCYVETNLDLLPCDDLSVDASLSPCI